MRVNLVTHRCWPATREAVRQPGGAAYRHRIVSNKPLIMNAKATA